jgi:hypothetical protein
MATTLTANQQSALDYAVGYYRLYYFEAGTNWSDEQERSIYEAVKETKTELARVMDITRAEAHRMIAAAYDATIAQVNA